MKIKTNPNFSPLGSSILFVMPSIMYLLLKLAGTKMHNEWLWYISIPILIVVWFIINFRIVRNNGNNRN